MTPPTISVPLRLAQLREGESARLWVLPASHLPELLGWLRGVSDGLIRLLEIALTQEFILLRVRPAQSGPAELGLGAQPFALSRGFDAFVPSTRRLSPATRPSVLGETLITLGQLTWLVPNEKGFDVHAVSATAFEPLWQLVDYRVTRPPLRLTAVADSQWFRLSPFRVADEHNLIRPRARSSDEPMFKSPEPPQISVKKGNVPATITPTAPTMARTHRRVIADVRQELTAVREAFLNIEGPPDHPDRLALWPILARLHSLSGADNEALLCWLSHLWYLSEPDAETLAAWSKYVWPDVDKPDGLTIGLLLSEPDLNVQQARLVVNWAAITAYASPDEANFSRLREALGRFLQTNENRLPVRLVWLTWLALASLTGDTLQLVRARDRLLARLMQYGLNRELDTPEFIRLGYATNSTTVQASELSPETLERFSHVLIRELSYGKFFYAFALARIGQHSQASTVLTSAVHRAEELPPLPPPYSPPPAPTFIPGDMRGVPDYYGWARSPERRATVTAQPPEPVRATAYLWLEKAFEARVRLALAGDPFGPLPSELYRHLARMAPETVAQVQAYRGLSRILEPFERLDPYWLANSGKIDRLGEALRTLSEEDNPATLGQGVRKLLQQNPSVSNRMRILSVALSWASRVSGTVRGEWLAAVREVLPKRRLDEDPFVVADLIERALRVAGLEGDDEQVSFLTQMLRSVIQPFDGERTGHVVGRMSAVGLRLQCRLGRSSEVTQLVDLISERLLDGKSAEYWASKGRTSWPARLRGLQYLGAAWLYLGETAKALELLQLGEAALFARTLNPLSQTTLAWGYSQAVVLAPSEFALAAIERLLLRLPKLEVPSGLGDWLMPYLKLGVMDNLLCGMLADDFGSKAQSRRWLDEDEFIVRRRLNSDVRAAMIDSADEQPQGTL